MSDAPQGKNLRPELRIFVVTDPDDLIQNLSLLCSGYLADPGEA